MTPHLWGETMAQTGRALTVAILGGLLALTAASEARARCGGGDLAGNWSMYATATGSAAYSLRCSLRFTKARARPRGRPIRYSIVGNCRIHVPAPGASPVATADGTLTEAAACKLTGSITLTVGGSPLTINVLDGRSEGGSARTTHIEVVGRTGGIVQLFNMSFVR